MKQMKVLLALVLALVMVMSLCACGGAEESTNNETVGNETPAATSPSLDVNGGFVERPEDETTKTPANEYIVTIVDEAGNPVEGAMVNVCNANGCSPLISKADGICRVVTLEEKDYAELNVDMIPEGYVVLEGTETKVYFEGGFEVTFVLQRKTAAVDPTEVTE